MTNQKPCLPGCYYEARGGPIYLIHAIGCQNKPTHALMCPECCIAPLRAEVEALRAAVRDGVVLLQSAHRYVLDADAQFFAFEIEQYIRAQKEHDHE